MRRRTLLKRKSVKTKYLESVNAIKEAILSDEIPEDEIDIEPHYERSTKTLGGYVTLDWDHKKDIDNLILNNANRFKSNDEIESEAITRIVTDRMK